MNSVKPNSRLRHSDQRALPGSAPPALHIDFHLIQQGSYGDLFGAAPKAKAQIQIVRLFAQQEITDL